MSNDIRRYVAVILKEPDTHYLATVPDLGACFSTGKTIEEAKAGLPDALTLHLEGMKAGGSPLPSPRSRAAVLAVVDQPVVTTYVIEIEPGDFVSPAATAHPDPGKRKN
jgi:predicted RNase H-like HicB family nuclease